MAILTKRTQVLFTEDQYAALTIYAKKKHKPLGTVVREIVERSILAKETRNRRQRAARRLLSKDLPVTDWERFEKELGKAHLSCDLKEK